MKKLRNIKPGQRKRERKQAREALEQKTAAFLDHPKECCVCAAPFERNLETVKTWHVVTTQNRVRLTCPECWSKIIETLEIKND